MAPPGFGGALWEGFSIARERAQLLNLVSQIQARRMVTRRSLAASSG